MAKELTLSIQERDFLKERAYDRQTIAVGYLGGLDRRTHDQYAGLMRQIQPDYSPTPWCDDCVYKMAKKVWERFGKLLEEAEEPALEEITVPVVVKPKRNNGSNQRK